MRPRACRALSHSPRSRTAFAALILALLAGCGDSGSSLGAADLIDASSGQSAFGSVCDDMVYSVAFPEEYAELKRAAIQGSARYWIVDEDGTGHGLLQNSISGDEALLRIDGDIEPGLYKLMMSCAGCQDTYLMDTALAVRPPVITQREGDVSPGSSIDVTGLFFGKWPSASVAWQETEDGEILTGDCTVLEHPEEVDDPYDETDERYPMDVSTGESKLRVVLPSTASTWTNPWLVIRTSTGEGRYRLDAMSPPSGSDSDTLEAMEERGPAEKSARRGYAFAYGERDKLTLKKRLLPIIRAKPSYRTTLEYEYHEAYQNMLDAVDKDKLKQEMVELYLAEGGFRWLHMKYNLSLFDIQYNSRDRNGNEIISSGVVILPWLRQEDIDRGVNTAPVLSFQHGTMLTKAEAPSMSWGPELAYAALFAATGYITVVPDLPGMGLASIHGKDLHPYCQAAPIGTACADMLLGVSEFIRSRNLYQETSGRKERFYAPDGRVYLTGYSEGGYATLALLRELTAHRADYPGVSLKAVAAQSGPYSLSDVMRRKLMSDAPFPVFYFAPYLIVSMAKTLNMGLAPSDFLAPGYEVLYDLIDGYHKVTEVDAHRPSSGKPREMFSGTAHDQMQKETGPFHEVLKANDLDSGWSWDPSVKVALIHGTNDDCVPYENSLKVRMSHPEAELRPVYTDFGVTRLVAERTLHELFFFYCMGDAWRWLDARRSEG